MADTLSLTVGGRYTYDDKNYRNRSECKHSAMRVIAAAVMPGLPSCNTNGVTMMIAERASALLIGTK